MSTSLKIFLDSRVSRDGTQAVTLRCFHSSAGQKVWKSRTLCRVKASQFDKAISRVKTTPIRSFTTSGLPKPSTRLKRVY